MSYTTIEQANREAAQRARDAEAKRNPPMSSMTLRDHIAIEAVVGLLQGELFSYESTAAAAYKVADAMLKARAA